VYLFVYSWVFQEITIDEVESIAACRSRALSNEPSDSIRVVNALLTQIDLLRNRKNVLILATSNITEAIDLAFLDRADIKQYLGPPCKGAIYKILLSCLLELMKRKIIQQEVFSILKQIIPEFEDVREIENNQSAVLLLEICEKCIGKSGRWLRKCCLMAHAKHVRAPSCALPEFLNAMNMYVETEMKEVVKK
jgi:SpoVK/Ycf46/Vps4 family AAA+-type ATPase